MSSELAALDEVVGRTWAIQVNFPDTAPRMASARETLIPIKDKAVKSPLNQMEIDKLGEELSDLRNFLMEVMRDYPETRGEFLPAVNTINYLIEPISQ